MNYKHSGMLTTGNLLFCVLCSIILCLFLANAAVAQDFTVSGLTDIWYIEEQANGNILAVDKNGKAAIFDYLDWRIVNQGTGSTFVRFQLDEDANCIIGTKQSSRTLTPYRFNLNTLKWGSAGPSKSYSADGNGDVLANPFFFQSDGSLYVVHDIEEGTEGSSSYRNVGIFKLENNSWTKVSRGVNARSGYYGINVPYSAFAPGIKKVVFLWDDGYPRKNTLGLNEDSSNRGTAIYSSGSNGYAGVCGIEGIGNTYASVWYSRYCQDRDRQLTIEGKGTFNIGSCSAVGNRTKDCLVIKQNNAGVVVVDSTSLNVKYLTTPDTALYLAACYDKFQNIIIGGAGGRVFAVDKSGVSWTDTSLFSDYLINDARQFSVLAQMAAEAAKTAAENAENNTWTLDDDGTTKKSAAVLAKEARDKANDALTTVNEVRNIVMNNSSGLQVNKLRGVNGATCTTNNSFTVFVEATGASEFRYCVDGGDWSDWEPAESPFSFKASGLNSPGAHTIYVEVRNAVGAAAGGQLTVFRL